MSTPLTNAQAATFTTFRNEVEEFLNSNSEGTKAFRKMDAPSFLALWKVASQRTELRPVANHTTKLAERGYTKRNSVKRTPDGEPRKDAEGNYLRTKNRVVMYTAEAYRTHRQEQSGLKKAETVYSIRWDEVPTYIQRAIERIFPKPDAKYPAFVPKNLCMVLRHGNKNGPRRNAWNGFDFCVSGLYGEQAVVIPQVAVKRRVQEEGSTTENIARVCGATIPDWGQNDAKAEEAAPQEEAPIAVAASVLSMIADIEF